jgi:serine/threonine protein kinase
MNSYISYCCSLFFFKGLQYLHSLGISHRDLKPSNILLTKDNVLRISDFGCSKQFSLADNPQGLVSDTVGSPSFWAPESLKPAEFSLGNDLGLDLEHSPLDKAATEDDSRENRTQYSAFLLDIWALGITLYAMTYHQLPFYSDDFISLINLICSKELEFKYHKLYDEKEIESSVQRNRTDAILSGLLEKEPCCRWMIENVLDFIEPIKP